MDLDPINIEQVQWLWLITRNMYDFQVQEKNWPAHVELSVKKRLDTKYISQAQHWYNTSADAARFMANMHYLRKRAMVCLVPYPPREITGDLCIASPNK